MPVVVRAVPAAEFEAWTAQARTRFAEGLAPAPVASLLAAQAPTIAATPNQTNIADVRR